MAKMLYITSLSGKRVTSFMRSAIVAAGRQGIDFTLLCNMDGADADLYRQDCERYGIRAVHVGMDRNPLSPANAAALRQLKSIVREGGYDIVHCNTPVGGLLGRLAVGRHHACQVVYMAHGFHFWKGAPPLNWLAYFPVERWLSRHTDCLVTINAEDYDRARKSMKATRVVLVPGVGIDRARFAVGAEDACAVRAAVRAELGISDGSTVFLSVGELNRNKNQALVLKALARLGGTGWDYVLCGDGQARDSLRQRAESLDVVPQVHFLGYRSDVDRLYHAADALVFPSFKEGLPSAVMEAMASDLPVVGSRVRGVVDLLPESRLLFDPANAEELLECLERVCADKELLAQESAFNAQHLERYDFEQAVSALERVYADCLKRMHAAIPEGTAGQEGATEADSPRGAAVAGSVRP